MKKHVCVNIDESLAEQAKAIAEANGQTFSGLVATLLKEHLREANHETPK